jgi:hypothetical protein
LRRGTENAEKRIATKRHKKHRKDKIFNANDARDAKKREEFYPQITQINADCF